jgi:hypothetical protein
LLRYRNAYCNPAQSNFAVPGILTGCIVPSTDQFQWLRLLLCNIVYESK